MAAEVGCPGHYNLSPLAVCVTVTRTPRPRSWRRRRMSKAKAQRSARPLQWKVCKLPDHQLRLVILVQLPTEGVSMKVKKFFAFLMFVAIVELLLPIIAAHAQNIYDCAGICGTADTNACWQCRQQVRQQQVQNQQQKILQQQQQNQARMQELMQSQQSTNCTPTSNGGFSCHTSTGMYR